MWTKNDSDESDSLKTEVSQFSAVINIFSQGSAASNSTKKESSSSDPKFASVPAFKPSVIPSRVVYRPSGPVVPSPIHSPPSTLFNANPFTSGVTSHTGYSDSPSPPALQPPYGGMYQSKFGFSQASDLRSIYAGANPQLVALFTNPVELVSRSSKQSESRFIQDLLEAAVRNPYDLQVLCMFVGNILDPRDFQKISFDPFGNYVSQKLIATIPPLQRGLLMRLFDGCVEKLTFNQYGCRVVQALMDKHPPSRMYVAQELGPRILDCIVDINANHVLQKLIDLIEPSDFGFIVTAICDSVDVAFDCAINKFGCLVLQKLIHKAEKDHREQLCRVLAPRALETSKSPFGNYVIQTALMNIPEHVDVFYEEFKGHGAELAMLKHSSNVIEEALKVAPPEIKKQLIDEIIDQENIGEIVLGEFGNYVVQKAVAFADVEQLHRIQANLRKVQAPPTKTKLFKHVSELCRKELARK